MYCMYCSEGEKWIGAASKGKGNIRGELISLCSVASTSKVLVTNNDGAFLDYRARIL